MDLIPGPLRYCEVLYEVVKSISSLDMDDVLNSIVHRAAEALGMKACSIRLMDETGRRLAIRAAYGLSENYLEKGPVEISRSPVDSEALSGKVVTILNAGEDPRFQYPQEAKYEGIRSVLCVPLTSKDKAIGVVRIYSSAVHEFTDEEVAFLCYLANLGAIAIENARTYQELQSLHDSRLQFVRIVTHELRSPLASIQSLLGVILSGYAGGGIQKQMELIKRAERRVDFVLSLVNDLLDLASETTEMAEGEKEIVDLKRAILQVVEYTRPSVKAKNVDLYVYLPNEPVSVQAVPEDIERIISNLLGNAVKYTDSEGRITISLTTKNKDLAVVEIKDTGIGIPAGSIPKIFDEFYRSSNAKKIEERGTGLGLAIVKEAVKKCDGDVSVESEVGMGTRFAVRLPACQAVCGVQVEG